jgi:hypothetical protein
MQEERKVKSSRERERKRERDIRATVCFALLPQLLSGAMQYFPL